MKTFNFEGISFKTETHNSLLDEQIIELSRGKISEYKLKLVFGGDELPTEYKITWTLDQIDTMGFWSPSHHFVSNIAPDWCKAECASKLTSGMPVASLYNYDNENRLTISVSDPKTPIKIKAGVVEETGEIEYDIIFFCEKVSKMDEYEAIIRLDTRKIPFYEAVATTKKWWQQLGYMVAHKPEYASAPLYSAWYSFHQRTIPNEIVAQCKIAKEYGMDTLIVDDGWQTDDNSRGYGYCGDWEVCQAKIPNMKDFVDRIHDLDMKFMIWFSVPFVGYYSKNYDRFKGKFLHDRKNQNAKVLDPRFKDVREFIVGKYVDFVNKYGIDGLKLDFIDSFYLGEESSTEYDKMDTVSVEDAVEMLLSEISERLKAINPDFLIEFRQSYVGPVISQYGNMLRVTDCPNDPLMNRVHSLNLRICQDGIIHSDMMMWNKDETDEAVAYQLISTLFSVPQISILFENITDNHKKILKNYISFWREHKDTILNGEMKFADVHANYSKAKSTKNGETISVLFQSIVETVDSDKTSYIFNLSGKDYIYLELDKSLTYQAFDMYGNLSQEGTLNSGVSKITLGKCSMIKIN
ncbi:MAG: alpha-galactosidase [Clostridia bacterium]|nr:alpha-galactosidase [Clostridia bacterium]